MEFNKICPQCQTKTINKKFCESCGTQTKDLPPPPPPPITSHNNIPQYVYDDNYRELIAFYNTAIYIGRILQQGSQIIGGILFIVALVISLTTMVHGPLIGIGILIILSIFILIIFGGIYLFGRFLTIIPLIIKLVKEIRDSNVSMDIKNK
ncbi:MAG TPA: hypothetical protein PLZ62_04075 [bacterium]|nr:hypothetical protein [bacterium]